jgi:hypothetical protein
MGPVATPEPELASLHCYALGTYRPGNWNSRAMPSVCPTQGAAPIAFILLPVPATPTTR